MNKLFKLLIEEDGMSLAEYGVILGVLVTVGATVISVLATRLSGAISKATTAIPS